MTTETGLKGRLQRSLDALAETAVRHQLPLELVEFGRVEEVGEGIATVRGLPKVRSQELVRFSGGQLGLAFNLDPEQVGVVLLAPSDTIVSESEVYRTGRVLDFPVGEALIGRVVDAVGAPLDDEPALRTTRRRQLEQPAPGITQRSPVNRPLQTGLKVIDALIPIGHGQRELILGDRQTGKTTLALSAILNQHDTGVLCIYCAVGQRSDTTAKVIAELRARGALRYTTVIIASSEDPPGLRYITPYAAMTLGEYFMHQGRDVLVVFDDLTAHARTYRELSLLLRRPPGREAYPGDIFFLHSRLLERATQLRDSAGGGSLTALPIIETQAENLSAYIPTNLISITDGQIYLSPRLFAKGVVPAVDVGRSVSRVGGKAQLPAYRAVAGDLRLSFSQFEELESFARFGTELDEDSRRTLQRGRRIREVLKQESLHTLPVVEQLVVLFAASEGAFDEVPAAAVGRAEAEVLSALRANLVAVQERVDTGAELTDSDRRQLLERVGDALAGYRSGHGNA